MSGDKHTMVRDLMVDGAKATPVAVYLLSVLNGVDWPSIAALLASLYTLLLLIEKVYRWIFKPKIERVRHKTPFDE